VFDNHAYMALYPVALVSSLLKPELTFAILTALAHVLLLVLPYLYLRRSNASWFSSLAFVVCVAAYAGWSYSATGEYYLDRLYMPLALMALYHAHRIFRLGEAQWSSTAGLAIYSIAAASCSERGAIMMLAMLVYYVIFFGWRGKVSPKAFKAALFLIAGIALYLFLYFKFVHVGIKEGGSLIGNLAASATSIAERLQSPQLVPFMLVNMLLCVLAAFSGIRYLALAMISMLPNLLISVGGAELNGWSTHYHSMYIPFLVFTASVGYANILQRSGVLTGSAFSTSVAIAAIFVAGWLNPFTGGKDAPAFTALNNSIVGSLFNYYLRPEKSYHRTAAPVTAALASIVPRGAKVSLVEKAMPSLYSGRELAFYPMAIDTSDYLVVGGSATADQVASVSGGISYLGAAEAEALDKCLAERISRSGFKLYQTVPSAGMLVFKRS